MHLAFRRAGTLITLALAASSAAAGAPAALELSVDPRFELLGVVRHLSALSPAGGADEDYRGRVEKSFGSFREHPAVSLYKDLAARESRAEALATILIYYTNPPELALKDPDADIH